MGKYSSTEEISSEAHVASWIFAKDLIFMAVYMVISYAISSTLPEKFFVPFMIYSAVCAVGLTIPSPFNNKRRLRTSLLIFLMKDTKVHRPITGKENGGTEN
ncbi:MAG: DUF5592 family protein [Roseburia sp.]|nr:DUF5592 family protein [Roseburia sp.]